MGKTKTAAGAAGRVRRFAYGAIGGVAVAAAGLSAIAQTRGVFASGPAADPAAATRGRSAFAGNCASCHGADLSGAQFGPALKGPSFEGHWRSQSAQALLDYISTRMPPAGPGSLGAQTYADLEAYILAANAGAATAPAAPGAPPEARRPAAVTPEQPVVQPASNNHDPGLSAATARRKAPLARLSPVTDAMLRSPADGDWLMWRRTYETLGYSRLKQIGKANVGGLRQAWSWALPVSQNEITPLVHDGVLFLTSGNAVQALDAANGDLLWQYVRTLPDEFANGRTSRVKSIGIYQDKLYVPTADGHLIALDAKTGKLVWDHAVLSEAQASMNGQAEGVALHMDGGPIIAKGKVIIGASLGLVNSKGGCFIIALDAATGAEVWRFNTVARPGQPGGDSWNGHPVEERFGAGAWTAGSYDPELNLVYFGTGNTYDTATLLEPNGGKVGPNDGLYTDSTLAIDADTGKLGWYFQHVKRDVWDLDWVFEQSLVTVNVDGKPRKLVVTGGKIALFEGVDRATGQYVFSKDLGLQNLVLSVDPKTGEKTINPAVQPEAGKTKFLCPSPFGARNWPATAFNPQTRILYVPLVEACMDYTYAPRSAAETAAGGQDAKFALRYRPDADGNFGRVAAIDLDTRKVVWTRRQRAPIASSMLATAGGVVFTGDRDRWFRALDQASGKVLWETRLSASPNASPVTYSVGGEQYVAVVAGGGGPFDGGTGALATEITNPPGGTTLYVFKLPRAARPSH